MGLTFIAVGVSVPDALSSLCVAKQGEGKMDDRWYYINVFIWVCGYLRVGVYCVRGCMKRERE